MTALRNFTVHIRDRPVHGLSTEAARILIAQFQCFVLAGRSARGHQPMAVRSHPPGRLRLQLWDCRGNQKFGMPRPHEFSSCSRDRFSYSSFVRHGRKPARESSARVTIGRRQKSPPQIFGQSPFFSSLRKYPAGDLPSILASRREQQMSGAAIEVLSVSPPSKRLSENRRDTASAHHFGESGICWCVVQTFQQEVIQ